MKALTIKPGWAWLILHHTKRIENRTWKTKHRGPILIHTSQTLTKREYDQLVSICRQDGIQPPRQSAVLTGGIIGVATVTHMLSKSTSPWFGGPWGWQLEDVRPLPYRPLQGKLNLWETHLEISNDGRLVTSPAPVM